MKHEDWLLLQTRVIGRGLHIALNDPPWNEVCEMCDVSFDQITTVSKNRLLFLITDR